MKDPEPIPSGLGAFESEPGDPVVELSLVPMAAEQDQDSFQPAVQLYGPDSEPEAAITAVLDQRRFCTIAQMLAALDESATASSIRDVAMQSDRIHLAGDVLYTAASLIAGRVYTARQDHGVRQSPLDDLAPFLGAQRNLAENPEGVEVRIGERRVLVVDALPTELGSDGQYLAVTAPAGLETSDFGLIGPQQLQVSAVGSASLSTGETEAAALRSAIAEVIPAKQGVTAPVLVAYATYLNDQCFRTPTLPISDLLAAVGLASRDGEWGRVAEQWATAAEGYTDHLLDGLVAEYRLEDSEAAALGDLVEQWRRWCSDRPSISAGDFVQPLHKGSVASAFAEYWQPRTVTKLDSWMSQRRLVETLARTHPNDAAVNYLRGMIDLRLGDGGTARDFFQQSFDADSDFQPVQEELGSLLLDQGQIASALQMLPNSSMIGGAVRSVIEGIQSDRAKAERSDQCRCESGRKYKSCCAKDLRLRADENRVLLGIRLQHFLSNPPWSVQMERLADIVSTECGLMSFPEALAEPIVQDVLAIEGGGAGAYLAARRSLLSEEEVALLAQFSSRRRRAFDVEILQTGAILTHPDTDLRLTIGSDVLPLGLVEGDAILARTVRRDPADPASPLEVSGPLVAIPGTHVALLRVTIGSRPTAEQLLGWIARRGEILRPVVDLTGEIDLRLQPVPTLDEVLQTVDLDDLARRSQ